MLFPCESGSLEKTFLVEMFKQHFQGTTLPETNIAPENPWLDDEFLFGIPYFTGYVSFGEGIWLMVFDLQGLNVGCIISARR